MTDSDRSFSRYMQRKSSALRLPQALQEVISDSLARPSTRQRKSRKEERKKERLERKQAKSLFFSASKRRTPDEHEDLQACKRLKSDNTISTKPSVSIPATSVSVKEPDRKAQQSGRRTTAQGKKKQSRSIVSEYPLRLRSQKEEEEDAYIAFLEAKLGYKKKSGKQRPDDDGLDGLLDFASSIGGPTNMSVTSLSSETNDKVEEYQSSLTNSEHFSVDEKEWQGIDVDDVTLNSERVASSSLLNTFQADSPEPQNNSAKYVLPSQGHLQSLGDIDSGEQTKLKKRLKGLLNRMSEQNMGSILDSVEEIYRNYRRNDVTSQLSTLIVNIVASPSSLLDSYVVLYAGLISALHKTVGLEFAAHFVQEAVRSYEGFFSTSIEQDTPANRQGQAEDINVRGKECINLIALFSELYNLQVVSAVLILDIIREILDQSLRESNMELILRIVKSSGHQLRQDDPSALKDIIFVVQDKASKTSTAPSSRTRFMLETLSNVKNNKLKKSAPSQWPDAADRMKRFLSGLAKKRQVFTHEPLRVSLNDLRSAESRGKWWLVGAAWNGDPLVERQPDVNRQVLTFDDYENTNEAQPRNDLSGLARSQGMNTDIRRSIFIVLMSSEDYVDACERLSQLSLSETQQREIVRVLLHCCGNEKLYNPFYALVGQRLMQSSHSPKITLQFCLWDFFRELGETTVGGEAVVKSVNDGSESTMRNKVSTSRMKNIAAAYGWWIAKDCLTLTVLKAVDFTVLQGQSLKFLRQLMQQIFINSQSARPSTHFEYGNSGLVKDRRGIEEIFIKATRIETLAMGLVYFLSEAFPPSDDVLGNDVSKSMKWAVQLAKDTLRTGVGVLASL